MILVNLTPNTVNADLHALPTLPLDSVRSASLQRYIARDPTFYFYCSAHRRVLHSFPTRRSSDLSPGGRLSLGSAVAAACPDPSSRRRAPACRRTATAH